MLMGMVMKVDDIAVVTQQTCRLGVTSTLMIDYQSTALCL